MTIKTVGIPSDALAQYPDYSRYLDALIAAPGIAANLTRDLQASDLIGDASKSANQHKATRFYQKHGDLARGFVTDFMRWEAAVWDQLVNPHVGWDEYLGLVAYTTQYYTAMNSQLRGFSRSDKISEEVWNRAPHYSRLAASAIDRFRNVNSQLFRPGITGARRETWLPTSGGGWNLGVFIELHMKDHWSRVEKGFMSTCCDVAWGAKAFYAHVTEFLTGTHTQSYVALDALTPFPGENEILFKPGRRVYVNRIWFRQRDGSYRALYDRFSNVNVFNGQKSVPEVLARLKKETPDTKKFRIILESDLGGRTPASILDRSAQPVVRRDFSYRG